MAKKKRKPVKRVTVKQVQTTEHLPAKLPQIDFKPEKDQEAWDNEGLTPRQRAFVEALVGPAGGVATRAAEMAGYAAENNNSLRATASYLLTIPNVQESIARAMARRRMTPEWAQERLVELASASMRNFVTIDAQGKMTIDWAKAAEAGAIGQIREIREDVLDTGDGKFEIIKRSFKLHDVVTALQTILRLSGLLKDEATMRLVGADGGKPEIKHTFDHDRFAELYRNRTGRNRLRPGLASPNGN
jgi:phage terminase small subunit